jgi:uncharacterized protein (UPF0147 family)
MIRTGHVKRVHVEPLDELTNDALTVAHNLRKEDIQELWAINRMSGESAIRFSFNISTEKYIAFDQSLPIAVFGVHRYAIGTRGVPWFLGTRGVDRCIRDYLIMGSWFFDHLLNTCSRLQNMALADNKRNLKFLSRIGFNIGKPFKIPTGANVVVFSAKGRLNV